MLYESTVFSLVVQIITGIIDVLGLRIPIEDDDEVLKDLLRLELGVQIIEAGFYVLLLRHFATVTNITPYRYFDWMITTPTMLVTLMAFLAPKKERLMAFLKTNGRNVAAVVLMNFLMLLAGFLGEMGTVNMTLASMLGFVPFVGYFALIYWRYLKPNEGIEQANELRFKKSIYWYFVVFWTLYGVASFLPYVAKNIGYNILDLFAKNLFGVFLVWLLWRRRQDKSSE
jgi:bacteriorhodopsin